MNGQHTVFQFLHQALGFVPVEFV
ncbi:hypothetical protein [Bartonella australis]|nr:hypothetical protein [Bartonella australis]